MGVAVCASAVIAHRMRCCCICADAREQEQGASARWMAIGAKCKFSSANVQRWMEHGEAAAALEKSAHAADCRFANNTTVYDFWLSSREARAREKQSAPCNDVRIVQKGFDRKMVDCTCGNKFARFLCALDWQTRLKFNYSSCFLQLSNWLLFCSRDKIIFLILLHAVWLNIMGNCHKRVSRA